MKIRIEKESSSREKCKDNYGALLWITELSLKRARVRPSYVCNKLHKASLTQTQSQTRQTGQIISGCISLHNISFVQRECFKPCLEEFNHFFK